MTCGNRANFPPASPQPAYNFLSQLNSTSCSAWTRLQTAAPGKESCMFPSNPNLRIAIYGSEVKTPGKGIGLWTAGYHGSLTAAGSNPSFVPQASGAESWSELMQGFHGVVVCGFDKPSKMGD